MLSLGLISLLIAVPLFSHRITPNLFTKITAIILIYSSLLVVNSIYIESLESGVGIYSGMFHITTISIGIEAFILFIGALIMIGGAAKLSLHSINNNSFDVKPMKIFHIKEGSNIFYAAEEEKFTQTSKNKKEESYAPFEAYGVKSANESDLPRVIESWQRKEISEYSLIIIFTLIGGCLLISSSDFISMYLSIELQSFGVYIMATLYRNSESATAAGLKYFLLGGLSSALILLGTALIYSYTGITQFESINSLLSVGLYPSTDVMGGMTYNIKETTFSDYGVFAYIMFGMMLIGVGLLFKVAAAPFHNWAPDVYNGVPTIVTSWLTTMPKISIFVFIMELMVSNGYVSSQGFELMAYPPFEEKIEIFQWNNETMAQLGNDVFQENGLLRRAFAATLKNMLLATALMSLIIGTIVGLTQHRIKRLLAYSTISHVGFMLLALSINTQESIESFLFYIIQYSITNVNTFLVLLAFSYAICNVTNLRRKNSDTTTENDNQQGKSFREVKGVYGNSYDTNQNLTKETGDMDFISDIKGQFTDNPLLALSFSLCLFSMAGIPPMVGFFAKQMVLYSSVHAGYYFISIIAIVVSVISASYYLKIIGTMYFSTSVSDSDKTDSISQSVSSSGVVKSHNITNIHSIIIATITTTMTLFVLQPSILLNSCHLLALSIFYY